MFLAVIALGMLVGAAAATWSLLAGGSILTAIVLYSAVGTLAVLATLGYALLSERAPDAPETAAEDDPRMPASRAA